MSAPVENPQPARFHVSLNVTDLARSVAFYRILFNCEPARQKQDYAKFELQTPPLVLSLIPGHSSTGGKLNHLGIRLPDAEALLQMQARLEAAGISTQREAGVECCHSTQTKFWVTDPDQTAWEFYILHADADEDHDVPATRNAGATETAPQKITWQHQVPAPFPGRIPHDDNSVHEVRLEGTANLGPANAKLNEVLAEAMRILRPGGELILHGLAGDKPLKNVTPPLPGPAAVVQHVPAEIEPMRAMILAGFVGVRFEKFASKPNFVLDGAELREILLTARKPGHRPRNPTHQAIYLGPLAQVTDDFGNLFRRGERVPLNIHDWQVLSQSVVAPQFLFLPPNAR